MQFEFTRSEPEWIILMGDDDPKPLLARIAMGFSMLDTLSHHTACDRLAVSLLFMVE